MNPSASKLPLLARCAWWARPDVALPVQDEPSVASLLGTALHAVADDADLSETAAALDVDEDDLAALAENYALWWPGFSSGKEWRKEVPFALDVTTGVARRLPSKGQRDYSAASDSEVPGTCDAVALGEVLDLKTGRGTKTVAKYREQLEHAALCLVATSEGIDDVTPTIAHVHADGVTVDSAHWDAFDLADAAERLRNSVAAIPTAKPRPGQHCRDLFCPALSCCPETTERLALVPDVRRLPLVGEVTNDADAWALVDALPRFEAWVKERKAALKRRALTCPPVHADGRRYAYVTVQRERLRLDVAGAEEAMRGALGMEATTAAIEVTRKTSKAAVKRAARAAGLPQAETERKVVAAMRAVGAVAVSEHDEPRILPPVLAAANE